MKKKKIISIIVLLLGLISFIIPIAWGLFDTVITNRLDYSFIDFLLYYSFLYWPTYIAGIIAIIISICIKSKKANSYKKN